MKKVAALMMAMALLVACLGGIACAEKGKNRDIVLMTEYQQMGWGESFQLGAVDSDGKLWAYESSTREGIPYNAEELLRWAESAEEMDQLGELSHDELGDIISLVKTVPAQNIVCESYACDVGVQTAYAIRGDRNGGTEIIVLGIAGDDTFENTDPAAQSLYKSIRRLFPKVKSFAENEDVAPIGFQKMALPVFCGYDGINLKQYKMTAYANDCETGTSATEPQLSVEDIVGMKVTGKKNSMSTTGDTVTYRFEDPDGTTVAVFEFYKGLLVLSDGMYSVE